MMTKDQTRSLEDVRANARRKFLDRFVPFIREAIDEAMWEAMSKPRQSPKKNATDR